MGRQTDATSTPVWVVTEPGVLVRYSPDGTPDRLLLVGPVTSDRLRAISLAGLDRISPHDTELPTWVQEQPPTADELDLVELFTFTHQQDAAEQIAARMGGIEYETADDFYKALADAITTVGRVDGSLAQAIADALDVTPNTAAQYIHRCRRRGHLPPSRKARNQ